jgi:hypothetical protein
MFDSMKGWLWAHWKILIGIFISTLAVKSGGIIGKILGSMGLSMITYNYVMPEIKATLASYLSGLSGEGYNLFCYIHMDVAMVMILSAGATKIASRVMFGKVT